MIVPLVPEEDWLAVLPDDGNWKPPAKPTLIISPHPDDETLGVGGLIMAQNMEHQPVSVVAVTDGEAAYTDSPHLAAIRRAEQEEAARTLGIENPLIRLALPDAELSGREEDLEASLRPLIHAGMLVLAPWVHDWHPDHEACARVARTLCTQTGAELISYLFWTWHRRTPQILLTKHLLRLDLSPAMQRTKRAAMECYVSQLQHGTEPILPELLLAPAYRPFEIFIAHA
jgi:LmbE family N-acetylglucosaminyl deacetylase